MLLAMCDPHQWIAKSMDKEHMEAKQIFQPTEGSCREEKGGGVKSLKSKTAISA